MKRFELCALSGVRCLILNEIDAHQHQSGESKGTSKAARHQSTGVTVDTQIWHQGKPANGGVGRIAAGSCIG